MPEHHVQGLEVGAVKLDRGHTGQTRKCAHHQYCGNRYGRELGTGGTEGIDLNSLECWWTW